MNLDAFFTRFPQIISIVFQHLTNQIQFQNLQAALLAANPDQADALRSQPGVLAQVTLITPRALCTRCIPLIHTFTDLLLHVYLFFAPRR